MPKRPVKEAEKLMRQALTLFESGVSREEIAKTMHVSVRTVHRWLQSAKAKTDVQTTKNDVQTVLVESEPTVTPEIIESPLNDLEDYYTTQRNIALELGEFTVLLLPLLKNSLKRFEAEDITPKTLPSLVKTMIDVINNSNECWIRATGIDIVMNKLSELDSDDAE